MHAQPLQLFGERLVLRDHRVGLFLRRNRLQMPVELGDGFREEFGGEELVRHVQQPPGC